MARQVYPLCLARVPMRLRSVPDIASTFASRVNRNRAQERRYRKCSDPTRGAKVEEDGGGNTFVSLLVCLAGLYQLAGPSTPRVRTGPLCVSSRIPRQVVHIIPGALHTSTRVQQASTGHGIASA
eukprot:1947430-Rhodomonas_salina.1